jgi:hypothetical protein
MKVAQVSKPRTLFEIAERDIPEPVQACGGCVPGLEHALSIIFCQHTPADFG